jgi:DNA-directed RNA polymerase subunit E'/Rpb7
MADEKKVNEPFIDTILHTKVELSPDEINTDLYITLKNKLISQVQGKNNKFGYVDKVYKIIEYSDGMLKGGDFEGNITYGIKYEAKIYTPQIGDVINAKVEFIVENMINCKNGPLDMYVNMSSKLNLDNFKIDRNGDVIAKSNNKKLEPGDNVIVKVIHTEFYKNQTQIRIYAYLDDIA